MSQVAAEKKTIQTILPNHNNTINVIFRLILFFYKTTVHYDGSPLLRVYLTVFNETHAKLSTHPSEPSRGSFIN